MTEVHLFITGLNPEPWSAGRLSTKMVGRRPVPFTTKRPELVDYQQAIRENVKQAYPDLVPFPKGEPLWLRFYIWRQLEQFTAAGGSTRTRQRADATNLQKALEDALQTVLFENDQDVLHASTVIMQQERETVPSILVVCGQYFPASHSVQDVLVERHLNDLVKIETPPIPGNVTMRILP